jgi:competence protein ComEA
VLERSSIGVLGVITAALALAALAAQPRSAATPAGQGARPETRTPSSSALRALRDGARIDVNRARPADLELLPGVGPMLARRIVEQRDAHGPFVAAEDLLRVRGIGPRTLERLRPLLAFDQLSNMKTTDALTAP